MDKIKRSPAAGQQTGESASQSPTNLTENIAERKTCKASLGPRERRLLESLLYGPLTREMADSVARASNGPHYIGNLRALGLKIPCKRRRISDSDGRPARPGVYHLDSSSQALARQLLAEQEAT